MRIHIRIDTRNQTRKDISLETRHSRYAKRIANTISKPHTIWIPNTYAISIPISISNPHKTQIDIDMDIKMVCESNIEISADPISKWISNRISKRNRHSRHTKTISKRHTKRRQTKTISKRSAKWISKTIPKRHTYPARIRYPYRYPNRADTIRYPYRYRKRYQKRAPIRYQNDMRIGYQYR